MLQYAFAREWYVYSRKVFYLDAYMCEHIIIVDEP